MPLRISAENNSFNYPSTISIESYRISKKKTIWEIFKWIAEGINKETAEAVLKEYCERIPNIGACENSEAMADRIVQLNYHRSCWSQ